MPCDLSVAHRWRQRVDNPVRLTGLWVSFTGSKRLAVPVCRRINAKHAQAMWVHIAYGHDSCKCIA